MISSIKVYFNTYCFIISTYIVFIAWILLYTPILLTIINNPHFLMYYLNYCLAIDCYKNHYLFFN